MTPTIAKDATAAGQHSVSVPAEAEELAQVVSRVVEGLDKDGERLHRDGTFALWLSMASLLATCFAAVARGESGGIGSIFRLALGALAIVASCLVLIHIYLWERRRSGSMILYTEISDVYERLHRTSVLRKVHATSAEAKELPVNTMDVELRRALRKFLAATSLPLAGSDNPSSRYAAVLLVNILVNVVLLALSPWQ